MRTLSAKIWKELPKDYKSVMHGQRYVLVLADRGTSLVPVKVTGMKKLRRMV